MKNDLSKTKKEQVYPIRFKYLCFGRRKEEERSLKLVNALNNVFFFCSVIMLASGSDHTAVTSPRFIMLFGVPSFCGSPLNSFFLLIFFFEETFFF